MKKISTLIVLCFSVFTLSAQDVETYGLYDSGLRPTVAIRASGDMTLLGMKFDWFNDIMQANNSFKPNPFIGATGYLGAAYEHPVSHNCAVAGGLGVSYGKAFMNDKRENAFYSYFSITTIYAEVYYALRLQHFYCNVGLRGGYTPLLVTEYRNGKDMFRGRMNNNHYTKGNIYGLIQIGYTTGRVDIGIDFNYALLSLFKEGFSYPVTNSYSSVKTMYMNVGVNLAYRIFVGK